jgi:hypothetical protein
MAHDLTDGPAEPKGDLHQAAMRSTPMIHHPFRFRAFLAALGSMAAALPSSADTNTWTNSAGDHQWSNPSNWNLGRVPNGNDHAVVDAPGDYVIIQGGAGPGSLWCTADLYVNDQLQAVTADLFGNVSFSGQYLVAGLSMNVYGALVMYSGRTISADPGATMNIMPGGSLQLYGPVELSVDINNAGTFLIDTPVVRCYPSDLTLLVLYNAPGSLMRFAGPHTLELADNANAEVSIINAGTVRFDPQAHAVLEREILLYNGDGTIDVDHAIPRVENMWGFNPDGGGEMRGTWRIREGTLLVPYPYHPDTVSASAHVILDGPNAWIAGMNLAHTNLGRLEAVNGANFSFEPYFGHEFLNEGVISVGPDSTLYVNPTLRNVITGQIKVFYTHAPNPDRPAILASTAIHCAGTLSVYFTGGYHAEPGRDYRVAGMPEGFLGQGIFGTFDVINMHDAGADLTPAYTDDSVMLLGVCRADMNRDGVLDLFDFLAFQNVFVAGDPAADFTGDAALDFFDFLQYQNEFAAGC